MAYFREKSVNEPKDCDNFKITSSFTQPVCAAGANMANELLVIRFD